jgi:hypothetical protein
LGLCGGRNQERDQRNDGSDDHFCFTFNLISTAPAKSIAQRLAASLIGFRLRAAAFQFCLDNTPDGFAAIGQVLLLAPPIINDLQERGRNPQFKPLFKCP